MDTPITFETNDLRSLLSGGFVSSIAWFSLVNFWENFKASSLSLAATSGGISKAKNTGLKLT